MASKRSNNARMKVPEKADDFKMIHGIGKVIERHLQTAGILTYSQLADLTPGQLAGLLPNVAGLTSEKIDAMNWSGQAARLAAEVKLPLLQPATPTPESRKHYSTYTVELLLDDENKIRRTRVVHIQSGKENAWAGWLPTQLENLILQSTGLSHNKDGLYQMRGPESNQASQGTFLAGQVRLQDIFVIKEENNMATQILHCGQPYSLRMILDFTDVYDAVNTSICFEAIVYARDLRSQLRETIGTSSGIIETPNVSEIRLPGKNLNRGMYRLEAVVTLSSQGDIAPGSGLMGMLEGTLLQVY